MKVLFYIILAIFAILGFGILSSAAQTKFKSVSLILGSICYIGAAISAYFLYSWWPLLIGFILASIVKYIFGDPAE